MTLPLDVLLGVYLGVLTGVVPALIAWALGFVFKYFTDVTVPGFAVVVLGVAIAGVNGGLLGLYDESIRSSPTLVMAVLTVSMMTLYAHNRGDRMGAELPHRVTIRSLRSRTLSADAVERVGRFGQVRLTVAGDVADLEGYPPLPPDLRAAVRDGEWTFPADLPLTELETRLADRLQTAFDLAAVSVTLDERGRASVAAAPPSSGVSRRVPAGERAVSVNALVPTGLARNDVVSIRTGDGPIEGTVVSARSDRPSGGPDAGGGRSAGEAPASDGGRSRDDRGPADRWPTDRGSRRDDRGSADRDRSRGDRPTAQEDEPAAVPEPTPRAPTTDGGEGRVTVAVDRREAEALLAVESARVEVRSRGTRREYELMSLLRQSGRRIRRLTVRADGPLDGAVLGAANLRDEYGVAVLAVRTAAGGADRRWQLAPGGTTRVIAGDELFVVGRGEALDRFEEVAT